jgi:hypothetical protein
MTEITSAETHRREHEWLRVAFDDEDRTMAFQQALRNLTVKPALLGPLIAVGEFRAGRTLIPELSEGAEFLARLGEYFLASGDDTFARAMMPRARASFAANAASLDAETLRALVALAEAVGDSQLKFDAGSRMPAAPAPVLATDPITAFVKRELGYAPDAPRGRLQLRPLIARSLRTRRIDNIHIGDALISVAVERTADALRFRIAQTAGAFPVRLILEPLLEFPVTGAAVDGVDADLEFRPVGDRILVPVQIVLDDVRDVVLSIA